jgi:hypothetical protein
MGQVGHADSKMTLDVYAQLQQRVKREHGRAFDTLVRQAREQLYGTPSGLPEATSEPISGHDSGHEATLEGSEASRTAATGEQDRATCRRIAEWRDPDSNRGHHDFQTDVPNARTGAESPATCRFQHGDDRPRCRAISARMWRRLGHGCGAVS